MAQMVDERIARIRTFAARNRHDIELQLQRYTNKLLGWSQAHNGR
jgi:hypothetical protein